MFNNFLFAMPLLSGMALTAVWVIIYLHDFVGVPTGQPVFPPNFSQQEIFMNLAFTPVTEKLGFRAGSDWFVHGSQRFICMARRFWVEVSSFLLLLFSILEPNVWLDWRMSVSKGFGVE